MSFFCFFCLFVCYESSAVDATANYTVFYKKNYLLQKVYTPEIELYWQVNPGTLHFATTPQKMIVARLKTDIIISSANGILKEDHFILQTPPKATVAELSELNILELRRYAVTFGRVYVSLRLTDLNDTNNKFRYIDSFTVAPDTIGAFYSNIQLLDTIIPMDAITNFLKNGKQIIPICANFLDNHKRSLFYYTELYNMGNITADRYPIYSRIRIGKKRTEGFMTEYTQTDTISSPSDTYFQGRIPIGKLTSGNYYLSASLDDKMGYNLASQSLFIQRLNLNPDKDSVVKAPVKEMFKDTAMESVTVLDLEKTFLAKYSLTQIKAMLKMLLPLSDPMQANTINNFLKKPDEMYMRYYIYNYYQSINTKDPAKAWKEYSELIMSVNKRFSESGNAGYETDRGMIYLRYGKPSEIVTVSGETGSLPYEIWQYNTLTQFSNKKELANALFLFYKPAQMMSSYRLLHSTVPGEVVNLNWRMFLYVTTNSSTSSGGSSSNSRAEQYFSNR